MVQERIILMYFNTRKYYPSGGVSRTYSRKQRQRPIASQKGIFNLYFPKRPSKMSVLKISGAFFINNTIDSVP